MRQAREFLFFSMMSLMSEEARVPVQNKNSLIALSEEARVPVQHRNSSEMAVPIEISRSRTVHMG
jgi:hypothetical protein